MSEFTINGNTYREKQQTKASRNASMAGYMIAMLAMQFGVSRNKQSNTQVNIITEFELIQQKKSNLSKSQRDWVVSKFNKRFELIQQRI